MCDSSSCTVCHGNAAKRTHFWPQFTLDSHNAVDGESNDIKLLTESRSTCVPVAHRNISHSRERLVPDLAQDVPDKIFKPGQLCCYKAERYLAKEDELDCRDKYISSLDFRGNSNLFAASTTRKELFVYKLKEDADANDEMPLGVHRLPTRPSALAWNRHSNIVTLGDHDGILTQIDALTGHILVEIGNDTGKPIWSIAKHKNSTIDTLVTTGGDGSVDLWSSDLSSSLKIKSRVESSVPACTAAFSTKNIHELSIGLSNSEVHVMDLRYLDGPMVTLPSSKGRPVAHVEYLNNGNLVCASLSSDIQIWQRPYAHTMKFHTNKILRGHVQERCFTGLSVNEYDFMASGSEDGRIYIYHEQSEKPLLVYPSVGTSVVASVKWVPLENDNSSHSLLMTSENGIQRCKVYQRGELV